MQGETNTSAAHKLLGKIDDMRQKIDTDPELSRRAVLQGLAATSILTALQGVAGLSIKPRSEAELGDSMEVASVIPDDPCGHEIACHLKVDGLAQEVPAAQAAPATVPETTLAPPETTTTVTTLPPATTTTMPPQPIQVNAASIEIAQPFVREVWWNPEQEGPRVFIDRYLDKIPTLHQLAASGDSRFVDADQQIAFIEQLASQVRISPEGFAAYQRDFSRVNAFSGHQPNYDRNDNHINPEVYVPHWTAKRYDGGIDGFVSLMIEKGFRCPEFIGRAPVSTFALYDVDTRSTGHAAGGNGFSYGVEIETETHGADFGHPQTPLYDFLPEQMDNLIYSYVDYCIRRNQPPDRTNIISHYALDLLFDRTKTAQFYNPETGEIARSEYGLKVDKWDPPQELISMLILPYAQALYAAVGPR